jgi:hypothetical protein
MDGYEQAHCARNPKHQNLTAKGSESAENPSVGIGSSLGIGKRDFAPSAFFAVKADLRFEI